MPNTKTAPIQDISGLPDIIFQGDELIALQMAVGMTATADDKREGLHGVCLDFRNQRMISADGHRCFIARTPALADEDYPVESVVLKIVNPTNGAVIHKIPANWNQATIDFSSMTLRGLTRSGVSEYRLERVTSYFPDVDRVFKDFARDYEARARPPSPRVVVNSKLFDFMIGTHKSVVAMSPVYDEGKCLGVLFTVVGLGVEHIGIIGGMLQVHEIPDHCEIVGIMVAPSTK